MSSNPKNILQVQNLSKSFLGVKALDNIQFDIQKGEVHALMGENGAGKSTFMKILIGLLKPDCGEIIFDGEILKTNNVHENLKKGISMIHQEILFVPELTVAQNIFLGRETNHRNLLNDKAINHKTQELLDLIGLKINAHTKIKKLSIAQMQMIEIAKAISNNAKVIIMDEPTSALSDKEVSMLFKIIKDLKAVPSNPLVAETFADVARMAWSLGQRDVAVQCTEAAGWMKVPTMHLLDCRREWGRDLPEQRAFEHETAGLPSPGSAGDQRHQSVANRSSSGQYPAWLQRG
jgi:ABC-type uncharacterized transport system ATPase subunit